MKKIGTAAAKKIRTLSEQKRTIDWTWEIDRTGSQALNGLRFASEPICRARTLLW